MPPKSWRIRNLGAPATLRKLPPFFNLFSVAAIAIFLLFGTWASFHRASLIDSGAVEDDHDSRDGPGAAAKFRDPTKGYWSPSDELKNTSREWGLTTKGLKNPFGHGFACYPPPPPGQSDIVDDGGLRAEQVDGWQWVIEGGYPVRDFDAEEFIVRALKSRMGFVVIGDSLSQQMMPAFLTMLGSTDPFHYLEPILVQLSNIREYPGASSAYWNVTLADGHAMKTRLLAREDLAHIPRRRFNEPIVRFFRSDMALQSKAELVDALQAVKALTDVDAREYTRTYAPWVKLIEQYGIEYGERAWDDELDSLVLINTGAHWDVNRMQPIEPEVLVAAYDEVLRRVSQAALNIRGVPLRILFRPTVPGHEGCQDYTHPVPPFMPIAVNRTVSKYGYWNWQIFPVYNEIARGYFRGRRGRVSLEYWDVWEMATTRPDAHAGWNGNVFDCLHWCPTSIPAWWIRLWWHTIQSNVESEARDGNRVREGAVEFL